MQNRCRVRPYVLVCQRGARHRYSIPRLLEEAGMLAALYQVGAIEGLGHWYRIGLAAAEALAIWQQLLIRRREPEACFRAFLNNSALGMVVFAGILLDYSLVTA